MSETPPEPSASHEGQVPGTRISISVQPARARRYWRDNLKILGVLLFLWATVSLGFGILGVEYLNQFSLGGFPLGFWFAQQGAIYVFIALILVYALYMDMIERRLTDDR